MAIYRLDRGSSTQGGGGEQIDPDPFNLDNFGSGWGRDDGPSIVDPEAGENQRTESGERRYSSKIAGYVDPLGTKKLQQAITEGVAGRGVADYEDYAQYLEDVQLGVQPAEGVSPYLGFGEQTDVVLRNQLTEHVTTGGRTTPGMQEGLGGGTTDITVYGRPLYRRGAEYGFGSKLDADGVRRWQSFFGGLGFKTGPAGMWGKFESDAMRAFMTMANTTPGGGMDVNTLRDRVVDQVQQGIFFFRGVNEEGDLLPTLLGEEPVGDLDDGGGGGQPTGPGFTEPYTETRTERRIEQYSQGEGKMALRNLVARTVGRAPTDSEVKQYVRGLNAAFNEDPTVISEVITTDPVTGESTSERTVDESDVSAEGRAEDFAREGVPEEELREHQTGRYMDALMSAIGM